MSDICEISTEPDSWSLKLFTLAGLWRAVAGGEKDETLQALALSFDPAGRIIRCIVCNAVVEGGANMGLGALRPDSGRLLAMFPPCGAQARRFGDGGPASRRADAGAHVKQSELRLAMIVQNRDGSTSARSRPRTGD